MRVLNQGVESSLKTRSDYYKELETNENQLKEQIKTKIKTKTKTTATADLRERPIPLDMISEY